jgi:hypothetical protein
MPSGGRRTAAVVLALAVMLAACGGGDEESAGPAPAPAPEPGEAIVVIGRAGLVFHDVSTSATLVFPEGDERDLPVVADEAAIQAAADAIRAWLDDVLSERNRGVTTTVATSGVDPDAFARALGADEPSTDGVLDVQVASATYLIEVAYLGDPGWALARVESLLVEASDPTVEIRRRLDSFVFAIDETGAVEFLALEVAP